MYGEGIRRDELCAEKICVCVLRGTINQKCKCLTSKFE